VSTDFIDVWHPKFGNFINYFNIDKLYKVLY